MEICVKLILQQHTQKCRVQFNISVQNITMSAFRIPFEHFQRLAHIKMCVKLILQTRTQQNVLLSSIFWCKHHTYTHLCNFVTQNCPIRRLRCKIQFNILVQAPHMHTLCYFTTQNCPIRRLRRKMQFNILVQAFPIHIFVRFCDQK